MRGTVRPITFAHRGARRRRPRTPSRPSGAPWSWARGLETDAWLSGDGEVVLVHDAVVCEGLRRSGGPSRTRDDARPPRGPRLADLYAELGTDYELSIDVKDSRVAERSWARPRRRRGAAERLWLCTPGTPVAAPRCGPPPRAARAFAAPGAHRAPLERHATTSPNGDRRDEHAPHASGRRGLVALFHRFDVQRVRVGRAGGAPPPRDAADGVDGIYCDDVSRMVATVEEWDEGD